MWIAYRCPTCDTLNHLALEENVITQGYVDGGPGPCHIPTRHIDIANLSVDGNPDGIRIKTLNLSWDIPATW